MTPDSNGPSAPSIPAAPSLAAVSDPGRLYTLLLWLVRVIVRVCFRVEVLGRENIPEGACIVVSNHLSWTDTAFILYALPRHPAIHTMANRGTVFNTSFKRWLVPRLAVFPVSRSQGLLDETAVNTVYELLNRGERVLIFPEGAYGRDGQLKPLKEGIGYFAINSGRPLLPIVLTGTGHLRPFRRVKVVIGPAFIPRPPKVLDARVRVRAVVASVTDILGRLGHFGRPVPAPAARATGGRDDPGSSG
ncbi:MAG: lysophospholipid acyltransferase family protein [Candidatus Dormibacteria bacterium]